jgi:hypothetical protein
MKNKSEQYKIVKKMIILYIITLINTSSLTIIMSW